MLTQTPNADPNANLDLNLAGGVSKLAGRHADIRCREFPEYVECRLLSVLTEP